MFTHFPSMTSRSAQEISGVTEFEERVEVEMNVVWA